MRSLVVVVVVFFFLVEIFNFFPSSCPELSRLQVTHKRLTRPQHRCLLEILVRGIKLKFHLQSVSFVNKATVLNQVFASFFQGINNNPYCPWVLPENLALELAIFTARVISAINTSHNKIMYVKDSFMHMFSINPYINSYNSMNVINT